MADTLPEEVIAEVRDLLSRSTLSGIEYHELSARWTGARSEEDTLDTDVSINLQHRLSNDSFGIRMTGRLEVPFGEAEAVVAAVYTYEGDEPGLRAVLAFANEVAIMTLFPYLRESLSTITAKIFGEAILLPIVPRGELGFNLDDIETIAETTG